MSIDWTKDDDEMLEQMSITHSMCLVCGDTGFVNDKPCSNCNKPIVIKNKIEFSFIHKNKTGFDSDLFAIDIVTYEDGLVTFARRAFYIKAPRWLKRAIFCTEDF